MTLPDASLTVVVVCVPLASVVVAVVTVPPLAVGAVDVTVVETVLPFILVVTAVDVETPCTGGLTVVVTVKPPDRFTTVTVGTVTVGTTGTAGTVGTIGDDGEDVPVILAVVGGGVSTGILPSELLFTVIPFTVAAVRGVSA